MDSSELASEGLLPHSSCWEPESSWKPSFNTASFCMNRRDKQEIIWMKTWSAGRNWDTDAGRYTESKNRMWLGTVKEWEWSDEATVIYCNKRVRLNILHQQHFYCSWLNILSSFISWSRNWCFSDSCYKLIKEHLQRDKTLKCKRRPPLCSSACRPPPPPWVTVTAAAEILSSLQSWMNILYDLRLVLKPAVECTLSFPFQTRQGTNKTPLWRQ